MSLSRNSLAAMRLSTNDIKNAYPTEKRKKKIEIPIREFTSEETDNDGTNKETKLPVNKLTSLVRGTYLSYLIKLLSSNYQSCSNNESLERTFTERDIEQCAVQMEQKALRSSIVARLYQRAMARMVADIKRNTELLKLHSKFRDFSPSSTDRGTQTERLSHTHSNSKKMNSIDSHPHPMAVLPLLTDNNWNAPVDISDVLASPILPNETKQHWPSRTNRTTDKLAAVNKSLLTGTISSRKRSPAQLDTQNDSLDNNIESLFRSYSESDDGPYYDDQASPERNEAASIILNNPSMGKGQCANNMKFPDGVSLQQNSRTVQSLDERLAQFNFGSSNKVPVIDFSPENINAEEEARSDRELFFGEVPAEDCVEMVQELHESPGLSALDKRLAEIHGEVGTHTVKETETHKANKPKKRLVWRYEEMYYAKRLKLKLRSLGKIKRSKVERRLYELFEDNAIVSRKPRARVVAEDPLLEFKDRIKPWVVKHLMPYYKSGKIETRDFFKHVAKHVTDSLVDINHLPDEADVLEFVNVLLNA